MTIATHPSWKKKAAVALGIYVAQATLVGLTFRQSIDDSTNQKLTHAKAAVAGMAVAAAINTAVLPPAFALMYALQ